MQDRSSSYSSQYNKKLRSTLAGTVCCFSLAQILEFFARLRNFHSTGLEPDLREIEICPPHNPRAEQEMRKPNMYQKTQMILASAGLILGLCAAPVMAQSSGDSKMPMSKMSDKDKMAM